MPARVSTRADVLAIKRTTATLRVNATMPLRSSTPEKGYILVKIIEIHS